MRMNAGTGFICDTNMSDTNRAYCKETRMTPLVYIASPYSSKDASTRGQRYEAAVKCVNHFLNEGKYIPFSPIVYGRAFDRDASYAAWEQFCRGMIFRSDYLWILRLPGYEDSVGVRSEIDYAKRECFGQTIAFLDPESYTPQVWCERCEAWNLAKGTMCALCYRDYEAGAIPSKFNF